MPRRSKGPRLYLRGRAGRSQIWAIRDGRHEESTGCLAGDLEGAERALSDYITAKHKAPKTNGHLANVAIADVLAVYLTEHAPKAAREDFLKYTAGSIEQWWGDMTLSRVNAKTCGEYVEWRVRQGVSDQTARHDLKTLRAAINYYHASEYGPLLAVPVVTLPQATGPRIDYFLTRKQVADRIRAARKSRYSQHIIRQILIGCYSGTRPGATLRLRWLRSTTGGWFDLDTATLHRRGDGERRSKKDAPKCRIHKRLLPWLRRWKAEDEKAGITYVVHYYGKPVRKLRRSWVGVAIAAGHGVDTGKRTKDGEIVWAGQDGPHIMRHTAATWQMQAGVDPYEAAGYLGMSVETLLDTYGHHHPDFQDRAASAGGRRK